MFHVKHEKFVTIRLCGSDFGEMFHVEHFGTKPDLYLQTKIVPQTHDVSRETFSFCTKPLRLEFSMSNNQTKNRVENFIHSLLFLLYPM